MSLLGRGIWKGRIRMGIRYALLTYIAVFMWKPVFFQLLDNGYYHKLIKQSIIKSIPVLEYAHEPGEKQEHGADRWMKEFIVTPVQTFYQEQKAGTIAKKPIVAWGSSDQEMPKGNKDVVEILQTEDEGYTDGLEQNGQPEQEESALYFQELPVLQEPVISKDGIKLPNKQISIDRQQLDYNILMSRYYTVVSSTTLTPEDLNVQTLVNMDLTMKQENTEPQILIYHTHGMEMFADSTPGDRNTGIVGVGNYLTELLKQKYGYNVIHLDSSFDYVNGKLDRSKAYDYAYAEIAQVLANYPSIEVVIDLHRDGVGEQTHLVTDINGKPTAQLMFFNGISRLNSIGEIDYLYNPYRQENLALSLQMKLKAEEYYGGLTRRNYIQAYQYNLHVRPKSMLIEAGAQTNTFEEVKNAMEPLAALLYMELEGY